MLELAFPDMKFGGGWTKLCVWMIKKETIEKGTYGIWGYGRSIYDPNL